MTKADLELLGRFEEVWARVQSGRSESEPAKGDPWRERVMQGLHELAHGCRSMSAVACGSMKISLQKSAVCTGRMLRELQTEYFLETGDLFQCTDAGNFASCTLSNLRKLWRTAVDLQGEIPNDGKYEGLHASLQGCEGQLWELVYKVLP